MRKIIRMTLIILLAVLIIIQFIRPVKNISKGTEVNNISAKYIIPPGVDSILKISCNDCHSNTTTYPWYWQVQPVTWFMNGHIADAKRKLNFSTFASYNISKQYKLFDDINKEVKSGDMPITSYTLIHRNAILNAAQKLAIASWTTFSRKEIESKYPHDSLIIKKQQ